MGGVARGWVGSGHINERLRSSASVAVGVVRPFGPAVGLDDVTRAFVADAPWCDGVGHSNQVCFGPARIVVVGMRPLAPSVGENGVAGSFVAWRGRRAVGALPGRRLRSRRTR